MGKHTPGPWEIGGVKTSKKEIVGLCIFGPKEEAIVLVGKKGLMDGGEANARLIAAAPELLEALKECLKAVNTVIAFSDMAGHESLSFIRVKKMAEQAIAKAEGEK